MSTCLPAGSSSWRFRSPPRLAGRDRFPRLRPCDCSPRVDSRTEKGFDLLLRALAQAVAAGLDATLTLVGSGPEHGRLAALARPLGERVRRVPAVPRAQLWGFMDEAHAVVVPSRREGLGLVAAEALARGRPVVASRTGGLPELLAAPWRRAARALR